MQESEAENGAIARRSLLVGERSLFSEEFTIGNLHVDTTKVDSLYVLDEKHHKFEDFRIKILKFWNTKSGYVLGMEVTYAHYLNTNILLTTQPMLGQESFGEIEQTSIDLRNEEFIVCIRGQLANNYITKLMLITSEGKYVQIGEERESGGTTFEWFFPMKEKIVIGFRVGLTEYMSYLSPALMSPATAGVYIQPPIIHTVDVTKERPYMEPMPIFKTPLIGGKLPISETKYQIFDDLSGLNIRDAYNEYGRERENKFSKAPLFEGNLDFEWTGCRIERVDCIYSDAINGLTIYYYINGERYKQTHQGVNVQGNVEKLQVKTLVIEKGDYINEVYCEKGNIVYYLDIRTKEGARINCGVQGHSSFTKILNDLYFNGKVIAFYGTYLQGYLKSLGLYYLKMAKDVLYQLYGLFYF